jgi:hypothetical protein
LATALVLTGKTTAADVRDLSPADRRPSCSTASTGCFAADETRSILGALPLSMWRAPCVIFMIRGNGDRGVLGGSTGRCC